MARIIANLPYDLQLEVFSRTNNDDLTQLLIATVKHNRLKSRETSDSQDHEIELSKLRSLIQNSLKKILKSDAPTYKTVEERKIYYEKMSSPEGEHKENRPVFLTPKIIFQLLELFDTDSFMTTEQLDILKRSSSFDIFHGFKLQELFWETLRAAAAGHIKFIKVEFDYRNHDPILQHLVVPSIPDNDKILKTLKNNDLQVEFAIFGNLCLRYMQKTPGFEPKYVKTDVKINEFLSDEDFNMANKYVERYRQPDKSFPDLAIRNIHSGHVLNNDTPTNRFRPEFYWYGIMRPALPFHDAVCDNIWNNPKMHVSFLTKCFFHRRECVLAALRFE